MQLKPITTIAVLSLLFASLLVAGCTTSTTSTTNNTNQTTSTATTSTAATHDAFLEKYLAAIKNVTYANSSWNVSAWKLEWINSTSAHLQDAMRVKTANQTLSYDTTYTVFPTTQDATNYLNAMNKAAYSLSSTTYTGTAYQKATGHEPQVYKNYVWNEGSPSNISEYKRHEISQLDNFIVIINSWKISY